MPIVVRLPFAVVDSKTPLERVLSAIRLRSRSENRRLLASFAMCPAETQFAASLLERKRNLWLYRCNQRQFCGDFIAVDMSSADLQNRNLAVLELKSRPGLTLGGGGAGNQFQRVPAAVEELQSQAGVITSEAPLTLACGNGEQMLNWLVAGGKS